MRSTNQEDLPIAERDTVKMTPTQILNALNDPQTVRRYIDVCLSTGASKDLIKERLKEQVPAISRALDESAKLRDKGNFVLLENLQKIINHLLASFFGDATVNGYFLLQVRE